MKKLFAALCLLPCLAHAQFSLVATNENDASVKSFLSDVEAAMPQSMKLGINKRVTVTFKNLTYKGKVVWGQVVRTIPKANSTAIDIQAKLLENIRTGNNYDLAKRTLLHEISHVYDFQNLQVGHEKELGIKNKSYTVSDSPVFLSVTGWDKKRFKYVQTNTLQTRRVDVYEDKSPQETFAVNIEHFLTDKEFKCRKPSLYTYLAKTLATEPFKGEACETDYRLPPTIAFDGSVQNQKVLDPSRLYDVHYFFAGKGTNVMSKWGHAMIRLVMCAPTRTKVDEKCLQDRAHHLVLSFRADITNFNIDYIKGVTGKYPSKMFVLSMIDVIKEYTVGELRDLYSIPLKMTKAQKDLLVSQVLERFWGYEGKYYFVTNNCADETLNLIRNVYLDDMKMIDMNVLTPLSLKTKFEKMGLSDMSVFNDLEDAKKKGYFFESLSPKLERVFADLANNNILPKKIDIEKFLNESTAEERQALAEGITDKGILGKLIFIEETILNRQMVAIQKKVGQTLDQQDRSEQGGTLLDLYNTLGEVKQKQSGLNLKHGYGLPQIADDIFETPNFTDSDKDELKSLQVSFQEELGTIFKKENEELMNTAKNKQQLFNQMIRKN